MNWLLAATLVTLGTDALSLSSLARVAIAPDVASLLTLNEQGSNGAARLGFSVSTSALNLSDNSWTVAGWIQRLVITNDDFVFYTGSGDGFGGSGEEFKLYCPSGASTVRARHCDAANTLDLDIVSGSGIRAGLWHHIALTFERTGPDTGLLRLCSNGVWTGVSTSVTWSLQQTKPLVFGGDNSSSKPERSWNGRFADRILFGSTACCWGHEPKT
jgi:hypothetical protein